MNKYEKDMALLVLVYMLHNITVYATEIEFAQHQCQLFADQLENPQVAEDILHIYQLACEAASNQAIGTPLRMEHCVIIPGGESECDFWFDETATFLPFEPSIVGDNR